MGKSPNLTPNLAAYHPKIGPQTAWFVARCSTCWSQAIVPANVSVHAPPTVPALCPRCGGPPRPFFLLAVIRSLVPAHTLKRIKSAVMRKEGAKLVQAGLPLLDLPDVPVPGA